MSETIVAIATAIVPQQGSVGIVRLSGSDAISIGRLLFHSPGKQVWESHRILYGYIRDPQTQVIIDEALLLLMLAPRSYTREDVVEFHCHGGIVAVQQVLQLCINAGAKLAQPGEFTLRAFLNGRLDLTQAESVADLVGARSPAAAAAALAGLQGKLAHPIRELRAHCLDILAEIEARIDFEEDLPPLDEAKVSQEIRDILAKLQEILATADQGELLRTGLKVAIVGRPNVGKSSLLNAWSRSDRAIVTDLPGTTRDVVESQLVVGGIPIQVLDTAGIRETDDFVEKIGVDRSRIAAQNADLILLTIDAQTGWVLEDAEIYQQIGEKPVILVINKVDLISEIDRENLVTELSVMTYNFTPQPPLPRGAFPVPPTSGAFPVPPPSGAFPVPPTSGAFPVPPTSGAFPVPPTSGAFPVPPLLRDASPVPPLLRGVRGDQIVPHNIDNSCNNISKFDAYIFTAAAKNQGIKDLENAILNTVNAGKIQAANLDWAINQRQAAALTRAKIALEQVEITMLDQLPLDFWSIDLRAAIQALGEVTGEEVTESVLDKIFSRFCIGK